MAWNRYLRSQRHVEGHGDRAAGMGASVGRWMANSCGPRFGQDADSGVAVGARPGGSF